MVYQLWNNNRVCQAESARCSSPGRRKLKLLKICPTNIGNIFLIITGWNFWILHCLLKYLGVDIEYNYIRRLSSLQYQAIRPKEVSGWRLHLWNMLSTFVLMQYDTGFNSRQQRGFYPWCTLRTDSSAVNISSAWPLPSRSTEGKLYRNTVRNCIREILVSELKNLNFNFRWSIVYYLWLQWYSGSDFSVHMFKYPAYNIRLIKVIAFIAAVNVNSSLILII